MTMLATLTLSGLCDVLAVLALAMAPAALGAALAMAPAALAWLSGDVPSDDDDDAASLWTVLAGPALPGPACRAARVAALRVQAAPPVTAPARADDDGGAAWAALVTAALAWTPVPHRPGRSEVARRAARARVAPSDDALARCARAGIMASWVDVSWYGTDGDAARAALHRAWPGIGTARIDAAVRAALAARA